MRIVTIIPYYGSWPAFMHLYLESCRQNSILEVVFVTDLEPFPRSLKNVTYHRIAWSDLKKRISGAFGIDTSQDTPYKL
jgi:hypothetical protein